MDRRRSSLRLVTVLLPGLLGACLSEHTTHVVSIEDTMPWLPPVGGSPELIVQLLGEAQQRLEGGRVLMWRTDENGATGWGRKSVSSDKTLYFAPFDLVVCLDRPELPLARIERISLVRIEGDR